MAGAPDRLRTPNSPMSVSASPPRTPDLNEQPQGPPSGGHEPVPVTVIEPTSGWRALGLGELWRNRELLFFITWRDVKVRYKQTALGAAWAVLQPLLLMLVFSVFLGHLAKVPSDGVPYPVFSFTALVPWTLFAQSVVGSSESLVANSNMVSKIYFPRLIMPVAACGAFGLDFLISLVLLFGLVAVYGVSLHLAVLTLPLFAVLALATAVAIGVLLSAVNVRYRDVHYAVPFLVQLWLFASPVAYSTELVPHAYRLLYALNPMVGVISGFRWAVLGAGSFPGGIILVSGAVTLLLLFGGLVYFRRTERQFADVI
jgi:lipopolysaccharide transport system permease protein